MLKVIFTILTLFSTPITATDNAPLPPEEIRLECNKFLLEISDQQVKLEHTAKSKLVHLKTAELIGLKNDELAYTGALAESIGDDDAVSKIMGQIIFNKQMLKDVELAYNKTLDRELELSTNIIGISMESVEKNCPNEPLDNAEILETCYAYAELKTNVNCMILIKPEKTPEKKDEPKKAHPNTLEV